MTLASPAVLISFFADSRRVTTTEIGKNLIYLND
jgi:hypothetical protein